MTETQGDDPLRSSKDDWQLSPPNSPHKHSDSLHDNGCKSLHNIREAVKTSEKSVSCQELPALDYKGIEVSIYICIKYT